MEVSRLLKEKADVLRRSELTPTDDAPASGRYELLNVFGTATGEVVVCARKGAAARGATQLYMAAGRR
jgi:hypothetical protein